MKRQAIRRKKMKVKVFLFLVILVFSFTSFASAAPAEYSFDDVAAALVRSARVTAVIESKEVLGELHNKFSKHPMSPLGIRIPEPPIFYFGAWGIDYQNNTLVGVDM